MSEVSLAIPSPVEYSSSALKEWLKPVMDPELNLSLVELGLVYGVDAGVEGKVGVRLTLTSPGCPAGDYMVAQIKERLKEHPQVQDVQVVIVWEPKWNPTEMASEECKEALGLW